ncbi:hypothetical protein GG681_15005 [Epibacterium sp. SM1969]|uniref:Universal stress protein family protein n=1 Tax=Tritonibacter aquimaris TaxID=2663379 RepID=A0A844B076_9RHOB|nr:universal stress protein [Tritonibacter aquimaris]MQY43954.1 hypothetical protein [Tritonibacter aquimaris]
MANANAGTAVVALDGGRRAARAVFDAMPILKRSKRVIFATIDEARTRGRATTGADNLEAVFGRYGLNIEHRIVQPAVSTAASLLQLCQEVHAAPLVMGAYVYSLWSEDLMGGVTHKLAQTLNVAILMSH